MNIVIFLRSQQTQPLTIRAYDGFTAGGKLISVMYVGNNKAVAYAREDKLGTKIDDFSHYYTVLDVVSKTSTPVTYNGQRLAYSSGRFIAYGLRQS